MTQPLSEQTPTPAPKNDSFPLTRWMLPHILLAVLFLVLFIIAFEFNLGLTRSQSAEIRGVESNVVYSIQQVMSGEELYPDPEAAPYAITQYSPLYYVVCAKIAEWQDLTPGRDVHEIYVLGRTLSLLASLILAAIIFGRCHQHRVPLLGFFAFVLALVVVMPWYTLVRPDAFAALGGIGALVLYSLTLTTARHRAILLVGAGLAGFGAILCKQNAVVFPLVIGLYLAWQRRWNDVFGLLIGFGLGFALSFIFIDYFSLIPTHDNFITDHLIGGVTNGTEVITAYKKVYGLYFSDYLPMAVCPGACAILILRRAAGEGQQATRSDARFWALAFLVITAFGLVTALKAGSAINYMNESMLVGMVLIARAVKDEGVRPFWQANRALVAVAAGTLVIFLVALALNLFVTYGSHLTTEAHEVYDQGVIALLEDEFERYPATYVFTGYEAPGLKGVLFRHAIFPQSEVAWQVQRLGVFEYDVPALIASGKLRYIIVPHGTPLVTRVIDAPVEGFTLLLEGELHDVYVNSRPVTLAPPQARVARAF